MWLKSIEGTLHQEFADLRVYSPYQTDAARGVHEWFRLDDRIIDRFLSHTDYRKP